MNSTNDNDLKKKQFAEAIERLRRVAMQVGLQAVGREDMQVRTDDLRVLLDAHAEALDALERFQARTKSMLFGGAEFGAARVELTKKFAEAIAARAEGVELRPADDAVHREGMEFLRTLAEVEKTEGVVAVSDVKAATGWLLDLTGDGTWWGDHASKLLAHFDGEPARTAAAVAAAATPLADRIAFLEKAYSQAVTSLLLRAEKAEAERDALRSRVEREQKVCAELTSDRHAGEQVMTPPDMTDDVKAAIDLWRETLAQKERCRCLDCDSARVILAYLDGEQNRPPSREELEYTRAMALLKQRYGDPLGDDLSDHVARLLAQVTGPGHVK